MVIYWHMLLYSTVVQWLGYWLLTLKAMVHFPSPAGEIWLIGTAFESW